jgi:hypothetical protein
VISRNNLARLAALVLFATATASCGPSQRASDNRLWSDSFAFRVTVNPSPPHDIEDATYKVVVQDKKTGEPIEAGQGRIFATNKENSQINTDDGFAKGKEVGTYYGRLRFQVTGEWAVAIQFRRDSTSSLERVDWVQTVTSSPNQ